jgi:hypothetical protein
MNLPSKLLAAAVLAISAAAFAAPGNAVPIAAPSSLQNAAAPSIEPVQWRRGGAGGAAWLGTRHRGRCDRGRHHRRNAALSVKHQRGPGRRDGHSSAKYRSLAVLRFIGHSETPPALPCSRRCIWRAPIP